MHPVFRLLAVTVLFVAGCVEKPDVSTATQDRVVLNRVVLNRVVLNKLAANKAVASKIAAGLIADGVLGVNTASAGEILGTDDGREVFAALVACALPDTTILEATVAEGTFDFFGEVGLAPEWIAHPMYSDSKRWVSACLFARVSTEEVVTPVSMRGPNPALGTDSDERSAFPLQEGGFYGMYFTPKEQPIEAYACRGFDKSLGDLGDLLVRNCAAPDAANPGYTLCGYKFAGDCGMFGAAHACEQFALGGTFFTRCHTEPTSDPKFPLSSPSFAQVITTYVRL